MQLMREQWARMNASASHVTMSEMADRTGGKSFYQYQ